MEHRFRSILKRSARHALRGSHIPAAVLVLLLIGCCSAVILLQWLVQLLLDIPPYIDHTALLRDPAAWHDALLTVSLPLGGLVLSWLLFAPFRLGAKRWYLLVAGGERPGLGEAFTFWGSLRGWLRALRLEFAIFWRMLAVGLLLLLPGAVVLAGSGMASTVMAADPLQETFVFIWALCGALLMVTGAVLLLLFGARYFAAPYLLAQGETRVRRAIRSSVALMRGRSGQWMELQLSFLGWLLLALPVVPLLYSLPYYGTTMAIYARYLTERRETEPEQPEAGEAAAPRYAAAIFDLDGTLLRTDVSIAAAGNRLLEELALPPQPVEAYHHFAGNGVRTLIIRLLGAAGAPPETDLDAAEACYRAHFAQVCDYGVEPYEGIPALLQQLRARGVHLAVCTNKPDLQARELVERFFPGCFEAVQGQTDSLPIKPDPTTTQMLAERMGVRAEECLYIGDSDVDICTGKAAGMFTVGVLWGFRDESELRAHGADAIVATAQELEDLL